MGLHRSIQVAIWRIGLANIYNVVLSASLSFFSMLQGVFYARNLYRGLTLVIPVYAHTMKRYIIDIWQMKIIKTNLEDKQKFINVIYISIFMVLTSCAIINAIFLGYGIMAIMGTSLLLQYVGSFLISTASYFANSSASYEEVKLPEEEISYELTSDTASEESELAASNIRVYRCYLFRAPVGQINSENEELIGELYAPEPMKL